MKTSDGHDILQCFPDNLRITPERSAIRIFLEKKYKNFGTLQYSMIVAFILYFIVLYIFETIHTTIKELAVFDNIFNLTPLLLFLGLAIFFHNRRKKFSYSERDIEALVGELISQRSVH